MGIPVRDVHVDKIAPKRVLKPRAHAHFLDSRGCRRVPLIKIRFLFQLSSASHYAKFSIEIQIVREVRQKVINQSI